LGSKGSPPRPLIISADPRLVFSLNFSPDSQRLAFCGGEPVVKIWDLHPAQPVLSLQGHTSRIHQVRYSPDGRWLATSSWDGTAKIWDAHSGAELLNFRPPGPGGFGMVFFSADNRAIVAHSDDGAYHRLAFQDFDELLSIVRTRATRAWKPGELRKFLPQDS
jgi:WD40 repeat protein